MRVGLGDAWRAMRTPDGPATLHVRSYRLRHPGRGVGARRRMGARQCRPGWSAPSTTTPASSRITTCQGAVATQPRPSHHALRRRHAGARPDHLGAEGDRSRSAPGIPRHGPGHQRARARRDGAVPPARPGAARRDALLRVPPVGGRAAAGRDRPQRVRAGRAPGSGQLPAVGSGERPAARASRAWDRGRWRRSPGRRSETPTRSRWATSTCPIPCAGRSRGEPRGTDEEMLELLEPYRGQRGRVQLLLDAGNVSAPAYGPRMEVGNIERI